MRIPKTIFLVPTILLLSLLMVVLARQPHNRPITERRLGIEIGLTKPFYVSAPNARHILETFLPVPTKATGEFQMVPFSAIKLAPRMVGNKVEVKVSVLYGDAGGVKTCADWDALKESPIASYTLSDGEEVTVKQLSNLGPNFKDGKLTFRAVPLKAALRPDGDDDDLKCGCATCQDGTVCCPAPGYCMQCSNCGQVCCKSKQIE